MFIYNSLSSKKEKMTRPRGGLPLRLFVCGPTVYDYPHIGNARTYVAFDVIVRFLRSRGYNVFYLQNITDVDDKIIARAKKERVSWKKISKKFELEYHKNERLLGISSVDVYARATDHIREIVSQVQTLKNKENAYEIPNDGYYFDISTFPEYGRLSRRTLTQAEDGISRIDESVKKRNKGDFCLWKLSPPNLTKSQKKPWLPSWGTPLGEGRPGWHIEDTAITEKYFGPQYDIHGGGIDLKFPHHEAEIAQQESASGKKPFVKLWMHIGSLTSEGKKMSKSLGNFVTVRDFFSKYPREEYAKNVFRMMVFQSHYRSSLNYTKNILRAAEGAYLTICEFIEKLEFVSNQETKNQINTKRVQTYISSFKKEFNASMEDDFNSSEALASTLRFINQVSPIIWSLSPKNAGRALFALENFLRSVGFSFSTSPIPRLVSSMAKKRELYRGNKQFAHADALRNKINALGYDIEDTPLGPFIKNVKLKNQNGKWQFKI